MLVRQTYLLDSFDLLSLSVTTTVGCDGGGGGGGGGIGSALDKRRICLSTILDSICLLSLSG
jgi:hypothetical protein